MRIVVFSAVYAAYVFVFVSFYLFIDLFSHLKSGSIQEILDVMRIFYVGVPVVFLIILFLSLSYRFVVFFFYPDLKDDTDNIAFRKVFFRDIMDF